MDWDVDAHEALHLLGGLALAPLAFVIFRARPESRQNRWFAAVLAMEALLSLASGAATITGEQEFAYRVFVAFTVVLAFYVPIYFGFLSTLGGRLGRALRSRVLRFLPWLLPILAVAILALQTEALVLQPDLDSRDPWASVRGPFYGMFEVAFPLTMIAGVVAASMHYRAAPLGTLARRQGALFALAFAGFSGGMILVIMPTLIFKDPAHAMYDLSWLLVYFGTAIVKLAFLGLITYAILRAQVFDVDLKVKWTIGRASAVTMLAGVFSAVKETVEYFVPVEGLVPNLAGAGAIALLAWPVARLGRLLADRLLPQVQPSETFLGHRRLEVFRASLESVASDGTITERERRMLDTLRKQLGIPDDEAQTIERTVMLRVGAPPGKVAPGASATAE